MSYKCHYYRPCECPHAVAEIFNEKPFAIRCNRCGGTHIVVTAFEHDDLGISCKDCGNYINVGSYESK